MKNVIIRIEETLLNKIDQIAAASQLSRSDIVREALHDWVRKKQITEFEQEWITKLKEKSEDSRHLQPWIRLEHWEKE
jgi:metal-responsive CopG/Arc/MetJ family transcriptional regulator